MKQRQTGLTLVELMVTLAAAIILLAVGLPFFGGMVANNRAVAEANGLLTSFRLARSEAVKRASYVAVAPTSVSAWDAGWLVYEESDRPGDAGFGTQQGGEPTLRTWSEVNASVTKVPALPNFVAFEPSGEASTTVNIAVAMDSSGDAGARSHCLQIGVSGSIRMETFRPESPFSETCP
jgi:type IV fimbrial biogenesis protein FimT